MADITIRGLSDGTYRGLETRAERNDRSIEAEARAVLDDAVHPREAIRLGSLLAGIGRESRGLELDRDLSATAPVDLT